MEGEGGAFYRYVNQFPIRSLQATPVHPPSSRPRDKLFSCARSRRHELFQRTPGAGSQGRSRCLAARRRKGERRKGGDQSR